MTLNNLCTPNGGKVHIHFGKQVTTNLWGRWAEVTDMQLTLELKACKSESDFIAVQKKHQIDWPQLTKPYTRAASSATPAPSGVPNSK